VVESGVKTKTKIIHTILKKALEKTGPLLGRYAAFFRNAPSGPIALPTSPGARSPATRANSGT
jgi:hypothetical protein